MTKYKKGDQVAYFQPGVDAILDAWATGKASRSKGGEEIVVTITKARSSGGVSYYDTDRGTLLTDDDILRGVK